MTTKTGFKSGDLIMVKHSFTVFDYPPAPNGTEPSKYLKTMTPGDFMIFLEWQTDTISSGISDFGFIFLSSDGLASTGWRSDFFIDNCLKIIISQVE